MWVDPVKAGNLSVARSALVSACAGDRWAIFAGGQIPVRTTVDMLGKLGGRPCSFRSLVCHATVPPFLLRTPRVLTIVVLTCCEICYIVVGLIGRHEHTGLVSITGPQHASVNDDGGRGRELRRIRRRDHCCWNERLEC